MLYEVVRYGKLEELNADAKRRYGEVLAKRTGASYDRFWRMEQVVRAEDFVWVVVWSKPAPLRKH